MSSLTKQTKKAEKIVAKWNDKFLIGTSIKYQSCEDSSVEIHNTSSVAYLMGSSAVILLENKSGCVDLEHCFPISLKVKK